MNRHVYERKATREILACEIRSIVDAFLGKEKKAEGYHTSHFCFIIVMRF